MKRMRLSGHESWRELVLLPLLLTAISLVAAEAKKTSGDDSHEACHDLYSYACKPWERNNSVPNDRRSEVYRAIQQRLRDSLISSDNNTGPVSRKVISLYQSCSDTNKLDELGSLKQLVQRLGFWPRSRRYMHDLMNDLDALDLNPIQSVGIGIRGHIFIERKRSAIDGALLEELKKGDGSTVPAIYRAALLNMVKKIFQVDVTTGHWNSCVQKHVNFSVALDAIMKKRVVGPARELLNVSTLTQDLRTKFDWLGFLKGVLRARGINKTVSLSTVVDIDIQYFRSLVGLIKAHGKEPLGCYLLMHTLQSCLKFLGQDIRATFKPLTQVLPSLRIIEPPECLDFVTGAMPSALTMHYVDKYFPQTILNKVQNIVRDTLKMVKRLKNNANWKNYTRERVSELTVEAPYSEKRLEDCYVQNCYGDLHFHEGNFLENVFALRRWTKNHSHPVEPTIRSIYGFARQNPRDMSINISTSYMMPPYYDASWTMAAKFGGIGSVIGRKVSDLLNKSALPPNDFRRWSQCLRNQYGRLTVRINSTLYHVNENRTLPSNINDNLGLLLAVKGYKRWAATNNHRITKTDMQRFFVSYAQTFCELMTAASAIEKITSDSTAPNTFRARVPSANLQDFDHAFGCRDSFLNSNCNL